MELEFLIRRRFDRMLIGIIWLEILYKLLPKWNPWKTLHLNFCLSAFNDLIYLWWRFLSCALFNLTLEHIEFYQFLRVLKLFNLFCEAIFFRFDIMSRYRSVNFKSLSLQHQLILNNLLNCLNFIIRNCLHWTIEDWQILCCRTNNLNLRCHIINILYILKYLDLILTPFGHWCSLCVPKLLERQHFTSIA